MPWVATQQFKWKGEVLEPGDFVDGLEHHRHRQAMVDNDKVKAVPPEDGECAFVARRSLKIDGEEYDIGDPIPNLRELKRWRRFLELGQVTAAPPYHHEEQEEQKSIEDQLDAYDNGGGVYDIPSEDGIVRGRDKAREILESA